MSANIGLGVGNNEKPPQEAPRGKIVVLNGFPGTGKFTILKRVKELLGHRARLLDNHLLIDPVVAVKPAEATSTMSFVVQFGRLFSRRYEHSHKRVTLFS